MTPLLVLAEFVFSEEGERAFLAHLARTLDEVRATDGSLQAVLWNRPAGATSSRRFGRTRTR